MLNFDTGKMLKSQGKHWKYCCDWSMATLIMLIYENLFQQECIPVGCVSTVAVTTTRCQYRGVFLQRGGLATGYPSPPLVNRQTLLKTLPSLAVGKNVLSMKLDLLIPQAKTIRFLKAIHEKLISHQLTLQKLDIVSSI